MKGPLHDKTAWFGMLGTLMLLILLIITKLHRKFGSGSPNSPIVQFDITWTTRGPHNVCVCVTDCYFIVNVLDLPFAFTYNDISQSMPINQY